MRANFDDARSTVKYSYYVLSISFYLDYVVQNSVEQTYCKTDKKIGIPIAFGGLMHPHNSIEDGPILSYEKEHQIYYNARIVQAPLAIINGTRLVCHKKADGCLECRSGLRRNISCNNTHFLQAYERHYPIANTQHPTLYLIEIKLRSIFEFLNHVSIFLSLQDISVTK